jgi:hypothetical protein
MSEYRTPEEDRLNREARERIEAVLEKAVHDGASLKVAMILHSDADVVEEWVQRLYDGLRESLSDDNPLSDGLLQEDRLAAITMLLEDRMNAEARSILRGMREAGDA